MLDFKSLITELSNVVSVTSHEAYAHEWFFKLCRPIFDEVWTDKNGSIIALKKCGKLKAKKLMLDAHLDEVGLAVKEITENGFIKFTNVGGIDTGILPASEVIIYGKQMIKGIITATPPHLIPAEDKDKKPKMTDLKIDTGYTKKELSEIVSPGDLIGYNTKSSRLINNLFYSKGMDDRICALCLIGAVDLLKNQKFNYDIYLSISVREETDELGVIGTAHSINPDLAIVVDVDFARLPESNDILHCILGKGGSISYTDTLNRKLADELIKAAKKSRSSYQITSCGGPTGTNAHLLQISELGIPSVVLSLPLKNMHTPVEICSVNDMESISYIVSEFAKTSNFYGEEIILKDE